MRTVADAMTPAVSVNPAATIQDASTAMLDAGVLEGLLAGLAHGAAQGIVHRDLKPENVLVTSDGRVKIADFGIAKATTRLHTGAFKTRTGTTMGTPNYMAPEHAMGQEVGPWTDLYSVGCMAFELLTSRVPFGDTAEPMAVLLRQINEPVPAVASVAPAVDPRISDWVDCIASAAPTAHRMAAVERRNRTGLRGGVCRPRPARTAVPWNAVGSLARAWSAGESHASRAHRADRWTDLWRSSPRGTCGPQASSVRQDGRMELLVGSEPIHVADHARHRGANTLTESRSRGRRGAPRLATIAD